MNFAHKEEVSQVAYERRYYQGQEDGRNAKQIKDLFLREDAAANR